MAASTSSNAPRKTTLLPYKALAMPVLAFAAEPLSLSNIPGTVPVSSSPRSAAMASRRFTYHRRPASLRRL